MTSKPLAFRVDEARCTRCGLCATDCPSRIIALEGPGFPAIRPDQEALCIQCQHCLAVCPEGAISILGHDPADSLPIQGLPTFGQMDLLARSRRSVRQYKDENVDPALLQRLLESLAHAPTGVNCRKLRFTVIQDKAVLAAFRERVLAALVRLQASGRMPEHAGYLSAMLGAWQDQQRDAIFRGAPHLLLVSAPPDTPTPQQDVSLTLAYFELLAQSAGLGTVWVGLLKRALELAPDLKPLLDLPADHIYYAMLFGVPAVRYHRTVQRAGTAQVHTVAAI
ncbi:MAG TPA: nitroreductase family protein [Holophaga sp.]|nr:nitroreductase family protein [Holophaga sp.]